MPVLSEELNYVKPYDKKYIFEIIEEIKPLFEYCNARGV